MPALTSSSAISVSALVDSAQLAPQPTTYEQMGAQLTEQFHLATRGMRAVLIFGAMLIQLREELGIVPARGDDSLKPGKNSKGLGLDGWLKQYAPEVPNATAYRYMGVAEAIREHCKLPAKIKDDPSKFAEFVQTDAAQLPEALKPKQLSLWEEVDGSSQRSWLDMLKPRKPRGGDTSKHRKNGDEIPDPMDAASAARDIWRPLGEEIEKEGLIDKTWKDLTDADREGLFRIIADLYKELRQSGSDLKGVRK